MKLVFTALIDFNNSHESDQSDVKAQSHSGKPLQLVDADSLLNRIATVNGGTRPDRETYDKNLFPAVLRFMDSTFRQRYLSWIYTNYSRSMVNQRRVRRIEREVIVTWAQEFNRRHDHLKIVQLKPVITSRSLSAKLQIIGYGRQFNKPSFDFQNALSLEYGQDYHRAFYNFELRENRHLASDFEEMFNRYMPDADFHFFDRGPDYNEAYDIQPSRYNQAWLQNQQKLSVSEVNHKLTEAQSAYHSVASQAHSFADEGAQIVSLLKNRADSASSARSSLTARLSSQTQANASLSAENASLRSNVASLSKVKPSSTSQNSSESSSQVASMRSQLTDARKLSASASQTIASLTSESNETKSMYADQINQLNTSADYAKTKQTSQTSLFKSNAARQQILMSSQVQSLRSMIGSQVDRSRSANAPSAQSAVNSSKPQSADQSEDDADQAADSSETDQHRPSGKAFYIPVIVIISIIIVLLLIFVFPLFRL